MGSSADSPYGHSSMSFESVARLAELAATDSGILSALQDDPARIRKPLQLSEAQVRALVSAGSFTSGRPARTTSQAEAAVTDPAVLMQLGTLGTLLPPEGSGAFPSPADLPPPQSAPAAVAPVHAAPSPQATPAAPQSRGPAPGSHSPSATPGSPAPRSVTPQSPSTAPQSGASPGSSGQTPGTPSGGAVPASGSQGSPASSSGAQPSASQTGGSSTPIQTQPTQTPGNLVVGLPQAPRLRGCCGCEVGMIALTAQTSATAQAALTAITAIAALD
jgi:hypothetical protein